MSDLTKASLVTMVEEPARCVCVSSMSARDRPICAPSVRRFLVSISQPSVASLNARLRHPAHCQKKPSSLIPPCMPVLLSTITRQAIATSPRGAHYCSKYLCSRHLSTFVLSILLHAGRHSAEKEFSSQDVLPAAFVKRYSSHRQALYCCHKGAWLANFALSLFGLPAALCPSALHTQP